MNTNGVPPPGCKVRGCCMGIPIGCGALAVLALLLSVVFTAGRTVQNRQDRRERADLRAEVYAVRDNLFDTAVALDEQTQRIERIEGKASPKTPPGGWPSDLHVATAARTEPAR